MTLSFLFIFFSFFKSKSVIFLLSNNDIFVWVWREQDFFFGLGQISGLKISHNACHTFRRTENIKQGRMNKRFFSTSFKEGEKSEKNINDLKQLSWKSDWGNLFVSKNELTGWLHVNHLSLYQLILFKKKIASLFTLKSSKKNLSNEKVSTLIATKMSQKCN